LNKKLDIKLKKAQQFADLKTDRFDLEQGIIQQRKRIVP
jgi:hypothetical protein